MYHSPAALVSVDWYAVVVYHLPAALVALDQGWELANRISERITIFSQKSERMSDLLKK